MKNIIITILSIVIILGVLALFNEVGKNTSCSVKIPDTVVGKVC